METRNTGYRFDLERDIPWDNMNVPGVYFSDEMLATYGMDRSLFDAIDGLGETFQWALAIGLCEEFIALEKHFLAFFNREISNGHLPESHSIELLEEEEGQHMHLLHRFADGLKAQRPALAKSLDRHLAASFATTWWHGDHVGNYPSLSIYHFINWLHALFFEEYTRYFHDTLKKENTFIQPVWFSTYHAYMGEEKQHAITDTSYLERLDLDHKTRRKWGHRFLERQIQRGVFTILEAVWNLVVEIHPVTKGLSLEVLSDAQERWQCFTKLMEHKDIFAATRNACGFSDLDPLFPDRRDENTEATDAPQKGFMDGDNPEPATLVDLLRHRAHSQPDKVAYIFLRDGEIEEASFTYKELDRRARAIAVRLLKITAPGERALLLYPAGLEFIAAFFGCLYAGVIAVPTYPPRRTRPDPRFEAIAKDAEATVVLTTDALLAGPDSRQVATAIGNLHWLATDNWDTDVASDWQAPEISGDTLAFLQYTSGSTGDPKGVMVSHGNLLHNSAYMTSIWQHNSESVMVTWLPAFHDMGLIFGILQPLYQGFPCYLMSPAAFVQRPLRWLQAISRYKATHSAAPNFGYELCIDKVTEEQRATLDLSSWEMSLNGAEPVRAETFERFNEYFKSCGLGQTTLCHGYGLAEATLVIAGTRKQDLPTYYRIQSDAFEQHRLASATEDEQNAQTSVSCGHSAVDAEIVIANPDILAQCRPDEVGEIWLSSPSVAHSYWQRPVETAETYHVHLTDTGAGPFLRTGDLGFLKDGELFVTGRLKDMIIIHGQNYYPQDIELTVERSHAALTPNGGAAFSVEKKGEERLLIVQEVQRTWLRKLDTEAVFDAIREAVSDRHELVVHAIVLLRPTRLPKTSSGKVQRRACQAKFLAGELDAVAEWRQPEVREIMPSKLIPSPLDVTRDLIRDWLIDKIAQSAGIPPAEIDRERPFAHYGLDSVAAVSMSEEIGEWLGRRLPSAVAYDYPTIDALTRYLAESQAPESPTEKRKPDNEQENLDQDGETPAFFTPDFGK